MSRHLQRDSCLRTGAFPLQRGWRTPASQHRSRPHADRPFFAATGLKYCGNHGCPRHGTAAARTRMHSASFRFDPQPPRLPPCGSAFQPERRGGFAPLRCAPSAVCRQEPPSSISTAESFRQAFFKRPPVPPLRPFHRSTHSARFPRSRPFPPHPAPARSAANAHLARKVAAPKKLCYNSICIGAVRGFPARRRPAARIPSIPN